MNVEEIDIKKIIDLAREAGAIHLYYYKNDNLTYNLKADNSEVSIADIESNELICNYLEKLYPQIPIISEENNNRKSNKIFWSIDPLDGTKSYIKGSGDFTVNIALVIESKPVFGLVYAPLSNELYYNQDSVAYKENHGEIRVRNSSEDGITVLIGSSTKTNESINKILSKYKVKELKKYSSALKFCLIAEGKADLYPRIGDTMEWDTAAGHAILKSAGGNVVDLLGNELLYGRADAKYLNPHFLASGKINL